MLNNNLLVGIVIASAILIVGLLGVSVANSKRTDLARYQCSQVGSRIERTIDERGVVISESHYPLDDRYQTCLAEKGL